MSLMSILLAPNFTTTHVQLVEADVFIQLGQDDLDGGHDEQLKTADFAQHRAKRDKHGSCRKVCR